MERERLKYEFARQHCSSSILNTELTATTPTTTESSSTDMPSSEGTSESSTIKPTTEDVNGEHKTGV